MVSPPLPPYHHHQPIGLGDLLVCRRVYVPTDSFAASLYPPSAAHPFNPERMYSVPNEEACVLRAARQAIANLSVSPQTMAFLLCSGLSASQLVVTIGSLRVDRLGEIREASDAVFVDKQQQQAVIASSLATTQSEDSVKRTQHVLCPVNYRARRIYWSCTEVDARVSYTAHVQQVYATVMSSVDAPMQHNRPTNSALSSNISRISTPALPLEPVPGGRTTLAHTRQRFSPPSRPNGGWPLARLSDPPTKKPRDATGAFLAGIPSPRPSMHGKSTMMHPVHHPYSTSECTAVVGGRGVLAAAGTATGTTTGSVVDQSRPQQKSDSPSAHTSVVGSSTSSTVVANTNSSLVGHNSGGQWSSGRSGYGAVASTNTMIGGGGSVINNHQNAGPPIPTPNQSSLKIINTSQLCVYVNSHRIFLCYSFLSETKLISLCHC